MPCQAFWALSCNPVSEAGFCIYCYLTFGNNECPPPPPPLCPEPPPAATLIEAIILICHNTLESERSFTYIGSEKSTQCTTEATHHPSSFLTVRLAVPSLLLVARFQLKMADGSGLDELHSNLYSMTSSSHVRRSIMINRARFNLS